MYYWALAALFFIDACIPLVIHGEFGIWTEEQTEFMAILCVSSVALFIAFALQKRWMSALTEKLSFQKKAEVLSNDLSHSYAYIGTANRREELWGEFLTKISALEVQPKNIGTLQSVSNEYFALMTATKKRKVFVLKFESEKLVVEVAGEVKPHTKLKDQFVQVLQLWERGYANRH